MEAVELARSLVYGQSPSEFRERFLWLIDAVEDPFSRDAQPHHITATAVVVSERGVLLHRHKRFGMWVGPGGHVDAGESPDLAVLREVVEETGLEGRHDAEPRVIDLDIHEVADGHVHYDLRFLLRAEPVDPAPAEGESQDVRWVEPGEAMEITDASFARAIKRALELS